MSAPGWFPDPEGTPGRLRWWDGSAWTPAVHDSLASPVTANQPSTSALPVAAGEGNRRNTSSWVIMGLLALVLGVTLGILLKPFGGPAPLPSSTHPAVADPSQTEQPEQTEQPDQGEQTEQGECSLGTEDGRLRAGALSVEAPTSPEWELLENYHQEGSTCANLVERPFKDVNRSYVIVFQRPETSADLEVVASNITTWVLDTFFYEPVVSSRDDTPTHLDNRELPTVRFEVSDLDRGRSRVQIHLADDGEQGYSIILTSCVLDAEDHCTEVDKVLDSLRWER